MFGRPPTSIVPGQSDPVPGHHEWFFRPLAASGLRVNVLGLKRDKCQNRIKFDGSKLNKIKNRYYT